MNFPPAPEPASLCARVDAQFVPWQLQTLKQWRVIRHLGSGSSAHVWLMQHATNTQYVACKTPKTKEDRDCLSQEADLAQSVSHVNLVQPLPPSANEDIPPAKAGIGTFWEYLPGGSLTNLIKAGGPLSLSQTVTIVLPMVQVAQRLTTLQIVHGDISPDNILFDLSGRPVLIDLGSTRASGISFSHTGTPGFIAPEIDHPDTELNGIGSAADVYSIAALAWFCLTGTVPGPPYARVPLVTLTNLMEPEVIETLEVCLGEEPALRPSVEQLLTAVAGWAEPEPVDLYPAVGEEYELLLPTRKPASEASLRGGIFKGRLGTRRRANRKGSRASTRAGAAASSRPGSRRMLLSLAAIALCLGGGTTAVLTQEDNPEALDNAVLRDDEETADIDFQGVVDTLAKQRSQAWSAGDASIVADYAAEDSAVFVDDVALLTSLAEAEHSLDGIRMRAVVEAIEEDADGAVMQVQWRTDGYSQIDAHGEVVASFESDILPLQLKVVNTETGWKLSEVSSL